MHELGIEGLISRTAELNAEADKVQMAELRQRVTDGSEPRCTRSSAGGVDPRAAVVRRFNVGVDDGTGGGWTCVGY